MYEITHTFLKTQTRLYFEFVIASVLTILGACIFAICGNWSWSQCGIALAGEFAVSALLGVLCTIFYNCYDSLCKGGHSSYNEQQPVLINGEFQGYQL